MVTRVIGLRDVVIFHSGPSSNTLALFFRVKILAQAYMDRLTRVRPGRATASVGVSTAAIYKRTTSNMNRGAMKHINRGRSVRSLLALAIGTLIIVTSVDAQDRDPYGGSPNIKGTANGWFHLEKIDDRDWMITPDGNAFYPLAVNHIPRSSDLPKDYRIDVRSRYREAREKVLNNIRDWGYNSLGYDSPREYIGRLPFFAILPVSRNSRTLSNRDFYFPDVFGDGFLEPLTYRVRSTCNRLKNEKMFIGYYLTNSPYWDLNKARSFLQDDWVSSNRRRLEGSPGKQRYVDFLESRYNGDFSKFNEIYRTDSSSFTELLGNPFEGLDLSDPTIFSDDEAFLGVIAEHYFSTTVAVIRENDPNHLIFGDRHKLGDHPRVVLEQELKYVDAIAIRCGPTTEPLPGQGNDEVEFNADLFDEIHEISGKPIIVCDHQCSFRTATIRVSLWNQFSTEQQAAEAQSRFLEELSKKPYIVGYHHCQYMDTYRKSSRAWNQGLVREDGSHYAALVERLGQTNRSLLRELYRETE